MTLIQVRICEVIAKHYRVKKAQVTDNVKEYLKNLGEEHPVVEVTLNNNLLRVGTSKDTIAVGKMFFHRLFIKTDLYAETIMMFENEEVECVCFYSGGAVMAISEASQYDGVGGIFLRDPDKTSGYAIEPLAHYLQRVSPVYFEE
jgi:hypothetical protein